MCAVTASDRPLSVFDGLLDRERSRRFHRGDEPFDLAVVRALLESLGELPAPAVAVHVAGSEGKTSTVELLAAGMGALGLSVGAYTSPHLRDPRERLRIDGRLPAVEEVRRAAARVDAARAAADLTPSWFEAVTAVARVLFAQRRVDGAVWETGLGGRLDATRLLPAHLCVITSISLEHTAILGDTLAEIAREKAGILRPGVPLLVGAGMAPEALDVLRAEAERHGCNFRVVEPPADDDSPRARNVALARASLELLASQGRLPAPGTAVRHALHRLRIEGRDDRRGDVIFDGAHTVQAAATLARRLPSLDVGAVVFGCTEGRDAVAMARSLAAAAPCLVLTRAPGERGVDPASIAAGLGSSAGGSVEVVDDPRQALERAGMRSGAKRQIVVTGSLYLVGHLLPPGTSPS